MIHIRDEGGKIKTGLNVYPLSSTGSIGAILWLFKWRTTFRYSKYTKKFHFEMTKIKLT